MSINQLIELTRRSFEVNSAAINTIGQNIANEQTEGYRRRRIELRADSISSNGVQIQNPINTSLGLGVSIQSIDSVRDQLLASSAWEARAGLGAADEESRLLAAVENLLPVNVDGSLSDVLNQFWNAWSDLSNNPEDIGVRQSLLARGNALAGTLNRIGTDLDRLETQITNDLSDTVDEFNEKIQRIAELNVSIQAGRAGNRADLTAEDERALLVTELSELAPVHVEITDLETYNISINGVTVVQGRDVEPLTLDTSGATPTLTFQSSGIAYNAPAGDDGRIGALLRTAGNTIADTRQNLDTLASSLVDRINTLHSTGYGLDGNTGRNFFNPAGVAAGTISISADIAEARFIAASDNADPTAIGDNDIAAAILAERTVSQGTLSDQTFENFSISVVSGIGSKLETATAQYDGHLAVVNYLDALEQGASGVSVNEELTNLIQFQQAFSAAARVLNTAQSMFDALLSI
ncbi:MAG: flagellar hook-associated protein FlgK [Rhodothermales bacterium]